MDTADAKNHIEEGTVTEGSRVTTRYFGGYEAVTVRQIHESYYVVSRFGGATTDILPKDRVEKIIGVAKP